MSGKETSYAAFVAARVLKRILCRYIILSRRVKVGQIRLKIVCYFAKTATLLFTTEDFVKGEED